jgi:cytochrome oxidase Cu insertion factor (SCO1/SenC/PrrC family)
MAKTMLASEMIRSLRPRFPRRLWSWGALVIIGAVSVACGGGSQPSAVPSAPSVPVVKVGEVAPDFSLPQASGGQVRLSGLHGKPVLLYFSMGPG